MVAFAASPVNATANHPRTHSPTADADCPICLSIAVVGKVFDAAGAPLRPKVVERHRSSWQQPSSTKRAERLVVVGRRQLVKVQGNLKKLGYLWRKHFGRKRHVRRGGAALSACTRAVKRVFRELWRSERTPLEACVGAAWAVIHALPRCSRQHEDELRPPVSEDPASWRPFGDASKQP